MADEWQDFEPDVDLSEPPDDAEPDFGETPDFGFSPSPGAEPVTESGVGTTNKSTGQGKDIRERARADGTEPDASRGPPTDQRQPEGRVIAFPGRPSPDAVDAAVSRIRLVEQIVASHIWSGGTRAEALAHLAKIGQIELDAGWVYRLGYR